MNIDPRRTFLWLNDSTGTLHLVNITKIVALVPQTNNGVTTYRIAFDLPDHPFIVLSASAAGELSKQVNIIK